MPSICNMTYTGIGEHATVVQNIIKKIRSQEADDIENSNINPAQFIDRVCIVVHTKVISIYGLREEVISLNFNSLQSPLSTNPTRV